MHSRNQNLVLPAIIRKDYFPCAMIYHVGSPSRDLRPTVGSRNRREEHPVRHEKHYYLRSHRSKLIKILSQPSWKLQNPLVPNSFPVIQNACKQIMTTLTWLVTGCPPGFGEELVQNILDRGDNVIATFQGSKDRIKYLKDAGAATLSLDLTASRFDWEEFIVSTNLGQPTPTIDWSDKYTTVFMTW